MTTWAWNLDGQIVNLHSLGRIATCHTLLLSDDDTAEVVISVKNGKDTDFYRVDLDTGLITESNKLFAGYEGDQSPAALDKLIEQGYEITDKMKPYLRIYDFEDATFIRFIVCLLTHQVRGEKLEQGLKANSFPYDLKIREDYLGGWLVWTKSDNRMVTLSRLLRSYIIRERKKEG